MADERNRMLEQLNTDDWQECRQSVLIVDDSAMNRRMLTEILGGRFDTAEATSGEECLHLLEENRDGISIVLLDIHMEGMDGFAVLEEMDRQKMLEDIPVIMISSEDKVDAMRRAFDLGASDYISRPFDARVVCQRIGNTMRLYAKQRRLCAAVKKQIREADQNSRIMLALLNRVMEKRNGESRNHVRRIQIITALLLAQLAQKNGQHWLTGSVRRRITLAAALVVAVYLNWQYARTGVTLEEDAVNVAATVETEEAVSAPIMDGLMTEAEAVSSANKNYGEAQLVSVANNSGSKFFEEARLKRTKAHDEAMDAVQKALKSASLSAEEKKSYTQQLTGSLEDLNAENEIETLVRAKGFADCLCFLQSGRADLTVMTSGDALTAAQVAQIRDIVLSKSNVTAQNITIVEVK